MVEKKLTTKNNLGKQNNEQFLIKEKKVEQKETIPLSSKEKISKLEQSKETLLKEKPKVIQEVTERPILQEVREKSEIQKRKKDVIKEFHEQPLIQVEEQPIIKRVERQPLHKKFTESEIIKEYGDKSAPNKELNEFEKKSDMVGVKLSKERPTIVEKEEKPVLSEVQRQEKIQIVKQPVIKEVHNQKIVEEYEQPITKKYYNEPIIKKVTKEPIYISESYEDAKLDRESQLTGTNKEQVNQVESKLESSIQNQYQGYTVYDKNLKKSGEQLENVQLKGKPSKETVYKEELKFIDRKGQKFKLDKKEQKIE